MIKGQPRTIKLPCLISMFQLICKLIFNVNMEIDWARIFKRWSWQVVCYDFIIVRFQYKCIWNILSDLFCLYNIIAFFLFRWKSLDNSYVNSIHGLSRMIQQNDYKNMEELLEDIWNIHYSMISFVYIRKLSRKSDYKRY